MKYMLTFIEFSSGVEYNITTTLDEERLTSFPAVVGNTNYDAFLIQVDLTDEEVHALPINEWIDA